MTYEHASVKIDGTWDRLWVPEGFRYGWGADAHMRCLTDEGRDGTHEVDVSTRHVGAIEWLGETKEVLHDRD